MPRYAQELWTGQRGIATPSVRDTYSTVPALLQEYWVQPSNIHLWENIAVAVADEQLKEGNTTLLIEVNIVLSASKRNTAETRCHQRGGQNILRSVHCWNTSIFEKIWQTIMVRNAFNKEMCIHMCAISTGKCRLGSVESHAVGTRG